MIAADFSVIAARLGLKRPAMVEVVGLGLLQAILEAAAVFLLLPALQYVQAGGSLEKLTAQSPNWSIIISAFNAVGLDVSLAAILMVAYLAVVGRQAAQYLQKTRTAVLRWQLVSTIRQKLFSAFLGADLAAVESEGTGKMLAEYTSETETAVTALFLSLQAFVLMGIVSIYLIGLLSLSLPLTLTALAIMGGTAAILRPVLQRSMQVGIAVSDANKGVSSFLVERLRQLRLVRLAGTEDRERALAATLIETQTRSQVDAEYLVAKVTSFIEPVFIGFAFCCLWFGAAYLNLGLDLLGIFLLIVLRLVPIGKDLMNARQNILQTTPALHLVDATLTRLETAREIDRGTKQAAATAPLITFAAVAYTYAGGKKALSNVTLAIPAGRMTALVGPSGAGKSTLVDLLPHLRTPTSGVLRFDGTDINDVSLASLRAAIAYLPQQPQIFDGTIRDHVTYGHDAASDRDVWAALEIARCDFVNGLPEKLDARVGEGGSRLSGGQRQRLDLARAMLRRAPLLILDEPTSALDAENEKLLIEALDRARGTYSPTILIVTHRLKFVSRTADQIIVLRNGALSEVGSHEDLLQMNGWYAKAWASQSNEEEILGTETGLTRLPVGQA